MGAQTKQIFIVIMLLKLLLPVVPVVVVPCGVSFPFVLFIVWSVVFLFFAPFYFSFRTKLTFRKL